jgi:secondary thiamine-phosphate synthase enzyme
MLKKIPIKTPPGESLVDITAQVKDAVQQAGVQEGLCVVFAPHTTAGLTINSYIDPNTAEDIVAEIHRLVPTRADFKHIFDTPADAAGHIKAVLIGGSQTLIVSSGELVLGHSQGILFCEFDGPRSRQVLVRVIADNQEGDLQ